MSPLRYFSRFEKADASQSVTFPTHRYEWEQSQPLRQSSVQLTGASYDYDQLEGAPALKGNGIERVRCMSSGLPAEMDDEIDDIKVIASWGRGKAWTTGASGERWAWARLVEMPQLSFTVENVSTYPIIMTFERYSDWYDEDPIGYEGEFAISSDPQTIAVTNPGTAPVRNMIIIVKDPTAQPFKLTNTTTGYVIEHDNFSGWFRFDTALNTVERSGDSGATWDDDSMWFVRQDGQVAMMALAPGANSIIVDNVNSGDVIFDFYGAYA